MQKDTTPTPGTLIEALRKMGDEFICKPKNLKGKELIKHVGLVWAAHQIDPRWTCRVEVLHFDQAAGEAVVFSEVTLNGALHCNTGEASPANLSSGVKAYPISMATTRAISRALARATGITLTSYEEMNLDAAGTEPPPARVSGTRPAKQQQNSTGQNMPAASSSPDEVPSCPECDSDMWDNRFDKRSPRAPDFKCKDRECGKAIWLSPKPPAALSAPGGGATGGAIDPELPF